MLLEKYIKEFLNEGRNDQNIFKSVIVLGPAGVGKSTAIRKIIGGTGLKYLNSDQFLEIDIQKDIDSMKDKESWDKARWMNSPEKADQLATLRKKAGKLNDKRMAGFIKNRLGIVIEGTASSEKSYEWFHNELITPLKNIGYDILVVGIYAPIHVCMQRNRNRGASGGRQIATSTMQSIFYGFIDEYYEIITKASGDLYEAVTILNTEFDDVSKKKISNYVHMINHPNTVAKSKKKVLKRLNDFITNNVPDYITKVAAQDPDITGDQLTEMLVEFLKSKKEIRNCMASLRIYQDMIDHNDKEQSLLRDSVEINSLDKIMRPFLEKNKKENIQKFDAQYPRLPLDKDKEEKEI
tara:strand:- start:228 stop:1283 length:1056 start_codon:yes stop_codon:yes gene_type:complete